MPDLDDARRERSTTPVAEGTAMVPAANNAADDAPDRSSNRETENDLVTATLAWSARRFGANASRFIRPTNSGGWLVVTWMNDAISVHQADPAESAMAWMVALGRQRLLVSKPRVSTSDDGGVRPISTRNYLGVPVICHDRILGVIEVAGDLRSDIETAAVAAQADIDLFALRLAFDTSLQPAPELLPTTIVTLSSGIWSEDEAALSPDEFRFVAVLIDPSPIADLAEAAGLTTERALEIACLLERRGLIEAAN